MTYLALIQQVPQLSVVARCWFSVDGTQLVVNQYDGSDRVELPDGTIVPTLCVEFRELDEQPLSEQSELAFSVMSELHMSYVNSEESEIYVSDFNGGLYQLTAVAIGIKETTFCLTTIIGSEE